MAQSYLVVLFTLSLTSALLYQVSAFTDPSVTVLVRWNSSGGDPCEESWKGISCNGFSVIFMNLSHNSLSGPVGNVFTSLQPMDLSNNTAENHTPLSDTVDPLVVALCFALCLLVLQQQQQQPPPPVQQQPPPPPPAQQQQQGGGENGGEGGMMTIETRRKQITSASQTTPRFTVTQDGRRRMSEEKNIFKEKGSEYLFMFWNSLDGIVTSNC